MRTWNLKYLGVNDPWDWRVCVLVIQESAGQTGWLSLRVSQGHDILGNKENQPQDFLICVSSDPVSPFTNCKLTNNNVRAFYKPKHGDDFIS